MQLVDIENIRLPDDLPYKASVRRVLAQLPRVDAVPVVRCKDCKYYSKDGKWCHRNSHFDDDVYSMSWNDFGDDDFCSYGERRADAEND